MTLFIIGSILLAFYNIFWMKRLDESETFMQDGNGKIPMFSWRSPLHMKLWLLICALPPVSIIIAFIILRDIRRGNLK